MVEQLPRGVQTNTTEAASTLMEYQAQLAGNAVGLSSRVNGSCFSGTTRWLVEVEEEEEEEVLYNRRT